MRIGKPQKIDWKKYRTSKFHFPGDPDGSVECGAYALYALTKKPYKQILKLSKKGHWPNSVMFGFLKKNGYEVIPVTIGNVVEGYSVEGYGKPKLNERNVLLIDQKCYEEENSWSVVYGNMSGHSGEVDALSALEFINWPIEAAYLIYHKSWSNK